MLRSKFSKINAGIRKRKALSVTEVFPQQKDNASNFYVPSPLTSSSSQTYEDDRYDSSEPTSLPPYPFHDNLETLAEGPSVPNSPHCGTPLAGDGDNFSYSKDLYENVAFPRSSPSSRCPRARPILQRSNSENRDSSVHDHSYENMRFQRASATETNDGHATAVSGSPYAARHLARSNSETREHSYENVHFQKNAKPRNNQSEPSFEEIHIPRVAPRKRSTDFKLGGQVNNYSSETIAGSNKEDAPASLGMDSRNPAKRNPKRLNSRSVANIPSSSGTNLKTWQVSG